MSRFVAWIRRFVRELRRRRVIRVAVVYAGTGFVILELADILQPALQLPSWTVRFIMVLLALGFPLAVGLAWVFDVTEEGLVRTGAEGEATGELGPGGKPFTSNAIIIGLLVLIAGLLLYPRLTGPAEESPSEEVQGSPTAPEDTATARLGSKSIAVLPFEALSRGEESETFARGVHDDLLTRLSNISDLQVISRTSVQQYRDTELSLPTIAESLGVRWVMEGGVQQADNQIQVNAQLIDPRSDVHRWADSYQRDLSAENLFAIQGEITREIADALQAQLTAGEQSRITGAPTENLRRAVELKPSYAQARHWLGIALLVAGHLEKAREHLSLTVELSPEHRAARGVLAYVYVAEGKYKKALAELDRARGGIPREEEPAWVLEHAGRIRFGVLYPLGRFKEARRIARRRRKEAETPTRVAEWRAKLGMTEVARGDTAWARRRLARVGEAPFFRGLLQAALGEKEGAFGAFQEVEDWFTYDVIELRYFYPEVLGPLREDPRYEELIRRINQQRGLNPDGTIPEETAAPTDPQANA